jgi:hypothetical protein
MPINLDNLFKPVAAEPTSIGTLYLYRLRSSDLEALITLSGEAPVNRIRAFLPYVASLFEVGFREERPPLANNSAEKLSEEEVEQLAERYLKTMSHAPRTDEALPSPIREPAETATSYLDRLLKYEVNEESQQRSSLLKKILELNRCRFDEVRIVDQFGLFSSVAKAIKESSPLGERLNLETLSSAASSALFTGSLLDHTKHIQNLASYNKALAETANRLTVTDTSIRQMLKEHNSLVSAFVQNLDCVRATDHLRTNLNTPLLQASLASQVRILGLETHTFGDAIGASKMLSNDLAAAFSKLTSSYRHVVEPIPGVAEHEVSYLASYAPIEYKLELDVLESITVEPREEHEPIILPQVEDALASFDSGLPELLKGARQALASDNPDKARHVTTSARELLTHLLHQLAPDEEIRKWSTDTGNYSNNQPTRRARLLYICRNFSGDPLAQFVEDDVRSALTLVNSLSAGTHKIQSKLTYDQLQAIVIRTESLAIFLLGVSRGGN